MRPPLVIVASLAAAAILAAITSGCSTADAPAPASYALWTSPEPLRSAKRGDEKSLRQFLSWATKYRDGASAEGYSLDLNELAHTVGDAKLAHVLETMALDSDHKEAIWEDLAGDPAYLLDKRKFRKDFPRTCKALGK